MDKALLDAASLWGAGLATFLDAIQIRNSIRDRPIIKIAANVMLVSVKEADPEYGTRQKTAEGGTVEIAVSVEISNHGRRGIQIVSVFIEGEPGQLHQVVSRNLPVCN